MRHLRFALYCLAVGVLFAIPVVGQTWQWAIKPIGLASTGFYDNSVAKVSIDPLGSVYVVGNFNDSATFGGTHMKSLNGLDMYVAKLNSLGAFQWAKTIGSTYANDAAIDVATDDGSNVYMAGYFNDSADFSGIKVHRDITSGVGLAKYNNAGTIQWAKTAAGLTVAPVGGLAYSSTGNLYLGCSSTLGKYDTNGDSVWTLQLPMTGGIAVIYDVAVDQAGSFVYISGTFTGSVDFGGTTLNTGSGSNYDVFIAKYSSDGNLSWAKQAGSTTSAWPEIGFSLDVDQAGNVYACGQVQGIAYFGTDSVNTGPAIWSLFVAKYNSSGDVVWAKAASGSGITLSAASEVRLISNETAILVAAYFTSSTTFGGLTYSILGGDALLIKMSSGGSVLWSEQSGSTIATIFVNGMDVNSDATKAVIVGRHDNQTATFTPYSFIAPPVGVADGFIVGSSTSSPTAVADDPDGELPSSVLLSQNYPNPFNPITTISYQLPSRSRVSINVYNLDGQLVRKLLDQEEDAGSHSVAWDGQDTHGQSVATGVYLYRISAGDVTESRKMLFLK